MENEIECKYHSRKKRDCSNPAGKYHKKSAASAGPGSVESVKL